MSFRRRKPHYIPELNTASLPDLIFTVLFFFMIVTNMKQTEVKVRYDVPHGKELSKFEKHNVISYIYIGKPALGQHYGNSNNTYIQLNEQLVNTEQITDILSNKRKKLTEKEKEKMTVIVQADKNTPMKIIGEVKQAIRNAKVLNIKYAAREEQSDK